MANQTLFSHATIYRLEMVGGKRTIDCCIGEDWQQLDREIDKVLEPYQFYTSDCFITVLTPARNWTFVEAAACVLGVPPNTPLSILSDLLIEQGYITTLAQDEELVEATVLDKNTGLVTEGYSNFAFKRNRDQCVSVSKICRPYRGSYWNADIANLECPVNWIPEHRLLIPNLYPSLLGLK